MLYSHIPQVVGIIGAGQMGSGIAQVCAAKGLDVIISDRSAGELAGAAAVAAQRARGGGRFGPPTARADAGAHAPRRRRAVPQRC
jgi:3-hydroxybutyryl-CoA dehydrogenase